MPNYAHLSKRGKPNKWSAKDKHGNKKPQKPNPHVWTVNAAHWPRKSNKVKTSTMGRAPVFIHPRDQMDPHTCAASTLRFQCHKALPFKDRVPVPPMSRPPCCAPRVSLMPPAIPSMAQDVV